jgi:hypothetical protein
VSAPALLVVHAEWIADGVPRRETYGPWTAADDGSHLEKISEFAKAWSGRTGILPVSLTLAVVVDPAEWLAGETVSAAGPPA